eukprot:m.20263 g.20263  ORF g.20263 m.20263 type:complete len:187 (+) comp8556_c0_seq4:219-779(+)
MAAPVEDIVMTNLLSFERFDCLKRYLESILKLYGVAKPQTAATAPTTTSNTNEEKDSNGSSTVIGGDGSQADIHKVLAFISKELLSISSVTLHSLLSSGCGEVSRAHFFALQQSITNSGVGVPVKHFTDLDSYGMSVVWYVPRSIEAHFSHHRLLSCMCIVLVCESVIVQRFHLVLVVFCKCVVSF